MSDVVVFVKVPSCSWNTHELDEEAKVDTFGYCNRSEAERVVEEARARASA